jgi:hypothetical protein
LKGQKSAVIRRVPFTVEATTPVGAEAWMAGDGVRKTGFTAQEKAYGRQEAHKSSGHQRVGH